MDIYCITCGEPWDNDSLHEVAEETDRPYSAVARDFRVNGCKALEAAFGPQSGCTPRDSEHSMIAAAAYDLLGDDMDGAMSMMDDWL